MRSTFFVTFVAGFAVDGPRDQSARILLEADAHRYPIAIRQEGQVEVACGFASFGGRLMPGADEVGTLFERVSASRRDVKCLELALHKGKKPAEIT